MLAAVAAEAAQLGTYSGKATVHDLGKIAFPGGNWVLEFRRVHSVTNHLDQPDYFVFRKAGGFPERLTFLLYLRTTTPRQLMHFLDTVGESMGDGIPFEEKQAGDYSTGEIHPMRLNPTTPTPTDRTIEYSFIYARDTPAPAWLCHSYLFLHGGAVFVIAHASSSVISPTVVQDVQLRSEFLRRPRELRVPNDRLRKAP
jgi:hypothetical protein